jgi:lysozyme family protein
MSDNFPAVYAEIRKSEGGYNNDPNDKGGETYAGIARNYNGTWDGWAVLDAIQSKSTNQLFPQLDDSVKSFYYTKYWMAHKLNQINDLGNAHIAMDTVVQHGIGGKLIQQALNDIGFSVKPDNIIGSATIGAINQAKPAEFQQALYNQRKSYYQTLDPSFFAGWMKRIARWNTGAIATGAGLAALAALATGIWYLFKKMRS